MIYSQSNTMLCVEIFYKTYSRSWPGCPHGWGIHRQVNIKCNSRFDREWQAFISFSFFFFLFFFVFHSRFRVSKGREREDDWDGLRERMRSEKGRGNKNWPQSSQILYHLTPTGWNVVKVFELKSAETQNKSHTTAHAPL